MVSTVDMNEITKYADTAYEAIIMIARRARQINDEQKMLLDREMEIDENGDDFDDEEFTQLNIPEHRINLPKPPTLAMQELFRNELIKEYADENVG